MPTVSLKSRPVDEDTGRAEVTGGMHVEKGTHVETDKMGVITDRTGRCITSMANNWRATPGLSAAILGSFQRVIRPMKMSAISGPSSLSRVCPRDGRL